MVIGVNRDMTHSLQRILIPALGLFFASMAYAQDAPVQPVDTGGAVVDSGTLVGDPIGQPFHMGEEPSPASGIAEARQRSIRSESFFESPTGTLLKSVAFPGWGQWANGKKQKAAVYFGIESYWITKALIWRHRAREADDLSEFAHARDRRNYFYWLTGITVFVSMFDAYADRYLLTLERTRDMPDDFWGERVQPSTSDGWRLAIAIKF